MWLPWVAVAVGAVLRIRNWVHDRSLWLDEILIATDIVNRGFGQLTHPLVSNNQAAPIGWLWAERVSINAFGVNEYALRLVPLLASLIALGVFPRTARLLIGRAAAPVATVLFATSPGLIYFAAETKQYSSDVACVLLVLMITIPRMRSAPSVRSAIGWGLACSVLTWFAFPAIAVAVVCAIALTGRWIRQPRTVAVLAIGELILVLNVVLQYVVTLRKLAQNTNLTTYWENAGGYPLRSVGILGVLRWLYHAGLGVIRDPGHLAVPLLVVLLGVAGLVKTLYWRVEAAVVVGIPVLVAVGLAVTRHYPLSMRLALYVVPSVLMLLAAGAVGVVTVVPAIARWTRWNRALRPATWAAVAVACTVLVVTAGTASATGVRKLWRPDEVTSGREAVAFVARHRQPSDTILVESWAIQNMHFYGPRMGVPFNGEFGVSTRPCRGNELVRLEGRSRVWLILAHIHQPPNRTAVYLSYFEAKATFVMGYHGYGDAGAYLLDFTRPPKQPVTPLPLWVNPGCVTISVRR